MRDGPYSCPHVELGGLQAPGQAADCFGAHLTSQPEDAAMRLNLLSLARIWPTGSMVLWLAVPLGAGLVLCYL